MDPSCQTPDAIIFLVALEQFLIYQTLVSLVPGIEPRASCMPGKRLLPVHLNEDRRQHPGKGSSIVVLMKRSRSLKKSPFLSVSGNLTLP